MQRAPVVSSNLRSVGYDADARVLEVEFRDGAVYRYAGVPQSMYAGLMAAASKGAYFDAHLKHGRYRYTKVR